MDHKTKANALIKLGDAIANLEQIRKVIIEIGQVIQKEETN
jgi:hypothetical protein